MKKILKKIIIQILTLQSKMILRKFNPYIIGVVGAVGKTSTKDSVASIFENIKDDKGDTLKYIASKKSMNSDFGVPLTIIGSDSGWDSPVAWAKIILKGIKVYLQKDYARYLILEVGADQKGDIKEMAEWLRCDIVIVTVYGEVPVHVENFKNRDELIKEDEYLVRSLKENGVLIFNTDCPDGTDMSESMDKEKISYGKNINLNPNINDIKIRNISNDIKRKQVVSQISFKGKMQNLECSNVLGEAAIYSALPAIIVSDVLNFDLKESILKIKNMTRTPGRMRILEGKNNSSIIDDTYNSSPVAVLNGLKVMKSIATTSRKIVVLGDMLELGKHAKEEHYKIGQQVAKSSNILITVGSRSKATVEGAKESGMGEGWILECKNSKEAGEEVLNILKEGDIVYIKGSQSMRMEKAVKLLVSETVDIKKELVRQDSEWLNR